MNTNIEDIINSISNGIIPEIPHDIEEKTELMLMLITYSSSIYPTVKAITISMARKENFSPGSEGNSKWIKWAKDRLGLCESYIYHLFATGSMLLEFLGDKQILERLHAIEFHKLYAMSALSKKQIKELLSAYNPKDMTRDEIRDLVNSILNRKKKKGMKDRKKRERGFNPNDLMYQPDLFDSFVSAAEMPFNYTLECIHRKKDTLNSEQITRIVGHSIFMIKGLIDDIPQEERQSFAEALKQLEIGLSTGVSKE